MHPLACALVLPLYSRSTPSTPSSCGCLPACSLRSNHTLMQRVRELNSWDVDFYAIARQKFCDTLRKHADLLAEAEAKSANICTF